MPNDRKTTVELVAEERIVTDQLFDLRDYFAAHALNGLMAWQTTLLDDLATHAYAIADEMLEARKRPAKWPGWRGRVTKR
jgi:hypothetical protein